MNRIFDLILDISKDTHPEWDVRCLTSHERVWTVVDFHLE